MELSGETRRRIEEHCRKISVAHNLDPEIQRELAGHMEDKILGYLSGAETLEESDAFIVARERFGDPALIKQMLGGVHAGAAAVSLARRVLAVAILQNVFAAAVLLVSLLAIPVASHLLPGLLPQDKSDVVWWHPFYALNSLLALWLQFRILQRWKRQVEAGRGLWFIRWPVGVMAALFVLLIALTPLKDLARGYFFTGPLADVFRTTPQVWFRAMLVSNFLLSLIFNAVLWLWWCDTAPRRPGTMGQVIAWFSLYILVESYTHRFIQKLPEEAATRLHQYVFFKVNGWSYTWNNPRLDDAAVYSVMLLATMGLAGVAWLIYELVRRRIKRGPGDGVAQ